jgi:hypothetical protein
MEESIEVAEASHPPIQNLKWICAPRGSRTPNPQIRSLMLYPVELWALRVMSQQEYC